MEIDKELLKGYVDIIVLSLLNNEPMYGYLLAKEMRQISGGTFDMKESTLYLALKRLEKKELVVSHWSEESGGGRRKVYDITDQGMMVFKKKRVEWEHFKTVIDLFIRRDIQ